MKSFRDYLAEKAEQPSTHNASEVPGVQVKIKSDGGWSDCSVKQVTPQSSADDAYWEISMNGKVHGKVSLDQTKGLGPNDERVLTIDGKEFWFGGQHAGGKFFESEGNKLGKSLSESARENELTDSLEQELNKVKVHVNQSEGNVLMLSSYTIMVKTSGTNNIIATVRDFDDKEIKKLSGGVAAVAKQIAAIKGIND